MGQNGGERAALADVGIRPSEQSPEEVGNLERLIPEVARALVRVTVEDIDTEINFWLRRIATTLGLDRSTITEINASTGFARFTYCWARNPAHMLPQSMNTSALLPWTKQKMLAGETVVMSSPDELPKEAAVDRESFHRYGPRSNVMVPIRVGGSTVGAISFASLSRPRKWSPASVRIFQAIAEVFACGLERKRAVAQIVQLRNELTHISRLTTMGQLSASIAHELNQPLSAILNNAEAVQSILSSANPDLNEVRAAISDIIEDDERAGQIIRRLWAMFRKDEVTRSEIDVQELLSETGRIVRADALFRNISLLVDVKAPVPAIVGERVQLQQAIINLVLNALDAVAQIEDGPGEVCVAASAGLRNGGVDILVRDSGKGISPEVMPKIFDAFFTTKTNGMGMGLAIAKSIVEDNGGRLTASRNDHRGMTFKIWLPGSSRDAV